MEDLEVGKFPSYVLIDQFYGDFNWADVFVSSHPKDVWDVIQETYSDLKNSSQIFKLKTQLWHTRQGNRAVF